MAVSAEALRPDAFVYVAADLARGAVIFDPRLCALEDRHAVELRAPADLVPADSLLSAHPSTGVVLEVRTGLLSRSQRALARTLLRDGRRLFLYWPEEAAVEVVDGERLRLLGAQGVIRRGILWVRASTHKPLEQLRLARRALPIYRRAAHRTLLSGDAATPLETQLELASQPVPWSLANELRAAPRPRPVALDLLPTPEAPLAGVGVYVRTDYWNSMTSGGSYGHTCYVAHELARSTREFVCLLPQHYDLLVELGVRQTRLEPYDTVWDEYAVIRATEPTRKQLLPLLRLLRPSYVYERLCPGNVAAAAACRELGIPYVAEYNGSEISISKSFGGVVPSQQAFQLALEDAAFRNATLISVVSDRVREDLLARGLPSDKVLVNPNGVDPSRYRPLDQRDRDELRRSLGFAPEHCVIGFTGTFGGWHGIDILAAALPRISERAPHVRFLLVGDGPRRRMVSEAIAAYGLHERVQMVGRVPQQRGARLLGACDIFVSPHSGHMVDQPFFGSPTKLFEYMATGGGIVASDLEQIGQVLRPALRATDLAGADAQACEHRAVLCRPGDVDDFVEAVVGLASRPDLARRLGANAREATIREFSWEQHVRRLWRALLAQRPAEQAVAHAVEVALPAAPDAALPLVAAEDAYKRQTQEHWNAEACGSQAARAIEPRSLEWYREVERYRYQDYAPWMPEVMEFSRHAGEDVLEIGAGIGTDLAQFATHGSRVVDIDLSAGHLEHARRNFELRGLEGRFVHHDAEELPFEDATFDLIYSNGVIHHTPNTTRLVGEIERVLRPGGRVIVMVYAQNSIHYWRRLFYELGLEGEIHRYSMGEIMSRHVELGPDGTRLLVKVYSRARLRSLFERFEGVRILKRQLTPAEKPGGLRWVPTSWLERVGGWNLVLKARKPRS